jgi:protein involved in polysaccharide export with SLBB domain
VLLALSIAACEPSATETNANNPKPAASPQTAATPAPISSPEASPATPVQLKAGDKVKVTIKGTSSDATVVSIDEKANTVTVRINGQKEDKTVPANDVTKQ